MGVRILSTGVSLDPATGGAVAHATAAARACLEAAGLAPDDVDLLIDVGVYRDQNMVEPAMAAIVQGDLGMRSEYLQRPLAGVSFDVMNGACGLLNAVDVASAALDLGDARRVLVVSADAHPSGREHADFPYASLGAAMLLGPDAGDGRGFGPVRFRDAPGEAPGVQGFVPVAELGAHGREHVTVQRDEDFDARILDVATELVQAYLAETGIEPGRTLLVPTRAAPGFGDGLGRRLGFTAVVHTDDLTPKDPHSSALTLAWHRATTEGTTADFDQALFVAGGAGVTSACALYRM